MKSDRICWIDNRTIKRGRVLVLDGSLVPFCSKCLGACMRANDALTRFEKKTSLRADCTSADNPPPGARTVRNRSREHVWLWWNLGVTGGQSGPGGRTVRSSNSNCTREGVFSGLAYGPCCGQSAPGARTVRLLFDSLYQRHCCL